jgi:hypothetical protein
MPINRINIPRLCFCILFATLIMAGIGGMTVVSMRQKIAESAQRLQKSESELTRLERLSEELRAKIAMMEHPEVLKKLAANFGMHPARLDQYRLVSEPVRSGPAQEKSSQYAKGF